MPPSVPSSSATTLRKSLAGVCPSPVKAHLDPQVPATRLRDDAEEAIDRTSSQKAAAATIGISQGRLSHKNDDGTLTLAQLETLGPEFAVEFGVSIQKKYGPLVKSPSEHAEDLIDQMQADLNELRQFVRHIKP